MRDVAESRLARVLCGCCLILLAWGLWPHVLVRPSPPALASPPLTVAIEGAVRSPGAYELEWGATVADLIDRADGLRRDAAREMVNHAGPLTAGEVVVIPGRHTPEGGRRVSLNTAPRDDLERLSGIGPALAGRIVAHRPFYRVDELLAVPGIGPVTLEGLRPQVTP